MAEGPYLRWAELLRRRLQIDVECSECGDAEEWSKDQGRFKLRALVMVFQPLLGVVVVPVGTALSSRAPDRTRRADFPHRAPTLGQRRAKRVRGQGCANLRTGKPRRSCLGRVLRGFVRTTLQRFPRTLDRSRRTRIPAPPARPARPQRRARGRGSQPRSYVHLPSDAQARAVGSPGPLAFTGTHTGRSSCLGSRPNHNPRNRSTFLAGARSHPASRGCNHPILRSNRRPHTALPSIRKCHSLSGIRGYNNRSSRGCVRDRSRIQESRDRNRHSRRCKPRSRTRRLGSGRSHAAARKESKSP